MGKVLKFLAPRVKRIRVPVRDDECEGGRFGDPVFPEISGPKFPGRSEGGLFAKGIAIPKRTNPYGRMDRGKEGLLLSPRTQR